MHFNPLPHTRENLNTSTIISTCFLFQSTPSYEGELKAMKSDIKDYIISIHSLIRGRTGTFLHTLTYRSHFNPLPHTRENDDLLNFRLIICKFQSTPSYEGEQKFRLFHRLQNHFNPLPHTRENEQLATPNTCFENISIHSLIRGRTTPRRSFSKPFGNFNPLPHTRENDMGETLTKPQKQFQSTPSYEGEPVRGCRGNQESAISIHSLIRGRTKN